MIYLVLSFLIVCLTTFLLYLRRPMKYPKISSEDLEDTDKSKSCNSDRKHIQNLYLSRYSQHDTVCYKKFLIGEIIMENCLIVHGRVSVEFNNEIIGYKEKDSIIILFEDFCVVNNKISYNPDSIYSNGTLNNEKNTITSRTYPFRNFSTNKIKYCCETDVEVYIFELKINDYIFYLMIKNIFVDLFCNYFQQQNIFIKFECVHCVVKNILSEKENTNCLRMICDGNSNRLTHKGLIGLLKNMDEIKKAKKIFAQKIASLFSLKNVNIILLRKLESEISCEFIPKNIVYKSNDECLKKIFMVVCGEIIVSYERLDLKDVMRPGCILGYLSSYFNHDVGYALTTNHNVLILTFNKESLARFGFKALNLNLNIFKEFSHYIIPILAVCEWIKIEPGEIFHSIEDKNDFLYYISYGILEGSLSKFKKNKNKNYVHKKQLYNNEKANSEFYRTHMIDNSNENEKITKYVPRKINERIKTRKDISIEKLADKYSILNANDENLYSKKQKTNTHQTLESVDSTDISVISNQENIKLLNYDSEINKKYPNTNVSVKKDKSNVISTQKNVKNEPEIFLQSEKKPSCSMSEHNYNRNMGSDDSYILLKEKCNTKNNIEQDYSFVKEKCQNIDTDDFNKISIVNSVSNGPSNDNIKYLEDKQDQLYKKIPTSKNSISFGTGSVIGEKEALLNEPFLFYLKAIKSTDVIKIHKKLIEYFIKRSEVFAIIYPRLVLNRPITKTCRTVTIISNDPKSSFPRHLNSVLPENKLFITNDDIVEYLGKDVFDPHGELKFRNFVADQERQKDIIVIFVQKENNLFFQRAVSLSNILLTVGVCELEIEVFCSIELVKIYESRIGLKKNKFKDTLKKTFCRNFFSKCDNVDMETSEIDNKKNRKKSININQKNNKNGFDVLNMIKNPLQADHNMQFFNNLNYGTKIDKKLVLVTKKRINQIKNVANIFKFLNVISYFCPKGFFIIPKQIKTIDLRNLICKYKFEVNINIFFSKLIFFENQNAISKNMVIMIFYTGIVDNKNYIFAAFFYKITQIGIIHSRRLFHSDNIEKCKNFHNIIRIFKYSESKNRNNVIYLVLRDSCFLNCFKKNFCLFKTASESFYGFINFEDFSAFAFDNAFKFFIEPLNFENRHFKFLNTQIAFYNLFSILQDTIQHTIALNWHDLYYVNKKIVTSLNKICIYMATQQLNSELSHHMFFLIYLFFQKSKILQKKKAISKVLFQPNILDLYIRKNSKFYIGEIYYIFMKFFCYINSNKCIFNKKTNLKYKIYNELVTKKQIEKKINITIFKKNKKEDILFYKNRIHKQENKNMIRNNQKKNSDTISKTNNYHKYQNNLLETYQNFYLYEFKSSFTNIGPISRFINIFTKVQSACKFYVVQNSDHENGYMIHNTESQIKNVTKSNKEKTQSPLMTLNVKSKSRTKFIPKYNKVHHVLSPNINNFCMKDYERLARHLLGRRIGLVLGGGGARGLAHIGIIQALEEEGIPIDVVGGTSMGAFVGACYSRECDNISVFRDCKKFCNSMSSKWLQILDLTYPICSIFSGLTFNRLIESMFKDKKIEDLWLEFFCISTNITNFDEVVHKKGILWRYVRASMSLAGYLPPLCDKNKNSIDLLLDGGYMNNVPYDVMLKQDVYKVIAIDVGSTVINDHYDYGDYLNGFFVLFQKFFGIKKFLSLNEIQYRLAYLSSQNKMKYLEEDKVLLLKPDLEGYKTMDFHKFDEIVACGYAYGKKIIKKWKEDGTILNLKKIKHKFKRRFSV
ncbi:hypothetical protein EDEG_00923, partial [Edhazardia aedis USNM 41457]